MADVELATVVSLLDDGHIRSVLTATSEAPLSANELSDHCGLSTSSIYRRIDQLREVNFIEEQTRPRSDGHHETVYVSRLNQFKLTVQNGELTWDIDRRSDDVADQLTQMWGSFDVRYRIQFANRVARWCRRDGLCDNWAIHRLSSLPRTSKEFRSVDALALARNDSALRTDVRTCSLRTGTHRIPYCPDSPPRCVPLARQSDSTRGSILYRLLSPNCDRSRIILDILT
nr:helix-turn-helix domain-containing protein [Halorussus amylolyticus]